MKNRIIKKATSIFVIAAITIVAVSAVSAFASSTSGTIDDIHKYAWSENIAWINFNCDNCNVNITDSGITGYAWSANYGWINLASPTSGVSNDGSGNLSGYAWGENIGWIDFSGVTIDADGYFLGYASSDVAGQISFNCVNTNSCASSDFKTSTDWRPRGERPACNNAIDDDNDGKIDYPEDSGCNSLDDDDEIDPGIGLPPSASNPPSAPDPDPENPAGEFSVLINNGDEYTDSLTVSLKLTAGDDTEKMAISDNASFTGASQIPYEEEVLNYELEGSIVAELCGIQNAGLANAVPQLCGDYGTVIIYVKFYTKYGVASEIVSDSIIYGEKVVLPEKEEPVGEEIIEEEIKDAPWFDDPDKIAEPETPEPSQPIEPDEPSVIDKIIDKIIDIFKPEPDPEIEPEIKIEDLVSKETPLAFLNNWILLPREPVNKFVLSPLPEGLEKLTHKFPQLQDTFEKVGINKITDLWKLRDYSLSLPGLTKSLGLEKKDLAFIKNIPLSEFPQNIKNKIPTEIIFTQIGGEKSIRNVDFDIQLIVNDQGETQQKIRAISGKKLFLTIKPESKAKSVYGYLAFKGTVGSIVSAELWNPNADILQTDSTALQDYGDNLQNLFNSFIFASPVFAQDYNNIENIEEKFITQKFAYADEDNDGIWTAEIYAPIVEGEYEVITLIEYEDPELGTRMVKLTTVVDPEGYVYENIKDRELRIADAVVSIYKLDSESDEYKLWQADNYQQKNPQTTDKTGRYSFLVPEGDYYITAKSNGYAFYQSKPFIIQEGAGVHQNIELKAKGDWLKMFDWKVLAIFLLFILIVWNFWKDRKRN